MEPGEPTFNMGRNDTIADNATLFFRSITAVITAGFAAGADDVAVTNKRTPPPLLAEQQQAEAALRHASKVAKKAAQKLKRKNMTTEERGEFNRQRRLSKAGMRKRDLPDEAEDGAPKCIKCGFRTHRDFCPDCGRPVF